MEINPYIDDILHEPEALEAAINGYASDALNEVRHDLAAGRYDRIILTGMGSSTSAAYPAWLRLAQQGLPAWWVETSELWHYAHQLITSRTLLWIISQSGRTAEVLGLLRDLEGRRPAVVLAQTNEPTSPLAEAADITQEIFAGREFTVGTKTYINSFAAACLASLQLTGRPHEPAKEDLLATAGYMRRYLDGWESEAEALEQAVGVPERMIILGRGDSLATATTGALVLKEGSKFAAEALSAGQYRHGPIEMTTPALTVLIVAGDPASRELNLRIGEDVRKYGGRAFWVAPQEELRLPTLRMPLYQGLGRLAAEILPFQLLTIPVARLTGYEPGIFLHTGKVVLEE